MASMRVWHHETKHWNKTATMSLKKEKKETESQIMKPETEMSSKEKGLTKLLQTAKTKLRKTRQNATEARKLF